MRQCPSASAMPEVLADSLCPAWTVPLIVGTPVAGLFAAGSSLLKIVPTASFQTMPIATPSPPVPVGLESRSVSVSPLSSTLSSMTGTRIS